MYVEVGFKTKRAMKKFYANGGVGAEVGFFYMGDKSRQACRQSKKNSF